MAAVNRPPPARPGQIGGNLHARSNSSVPTSDPQDPGLHGTGQDPGPSSHPHPHASARPVFYVHAPPPPPFLHYQWPMPFPYNPFAGFPGMGYGMVMPPFPPPPPYMEAPAYILPHPHIQPVDYRRLLHPPVHASSAPYQNPNQPRRTRPPHTFPVRETVNSEVQTEPTQRGLGGYSDGSPLVSSESGHGTASSSPSSSSSSSQKQGPAQVENYTLPNSQARGIQGKRATSSTVKHILNPIKATLEREYRRTQKSCQDSVGKENVAPCRTSHCNMWSVSSPDSMIPVCSSSQQEDEVVKERRVSVPDILMSWGGGTPQEMMTKIADRLPQNDHQLPSYETEVEQGKSACQSPAKNGLVVSESANDNIEVDLSHKDTATLSKVLELREAHEAQETESRRENEPARMVGSVGHCLSSRDELQNSLNKTHKLPDNEQEDCNETNPHEDTSDIIRYRMYVNSFQLRRKMNESVWSVESLAPFIPTKENLLQNSTFEPKVIVEMTEEADNSKSSTQNDILTVKAGKERRQTRRCSSSDSVLMSDSWLLFSTPAQKLSPPKKPELESEIDSSEAWTPKQDQSMAPSEKDPPTSMTPLPSKLMLSTTTEEDADKNRSSEPEAIQSPNQVCVIVNEQQEKSPCSPLQEEIRLLNSAAGENRSPRGQTGVDVEGEDQTCRSKQVSELFREQLCVPMANQELAEVSPSKKNLVDFGVQFSGCHCPYEEMKSSMGPDRRQQFKYPDMRKANNGQADGFGMRGNKNQRRGHWRNKGQGGNGRNPRY
ncbi:uncharacterized protein LOC121950982 [Plectropomus leopardus]|uniref:uncharacterized protein LOC121950982 n=1 Tax=Plectropomus leopardus TaxID=160734 RepID=UPI001C4CB0B6|nr:uncharacterized protein LOC121950982 [Plectropomus leopardus]